MNNSIKINSIETLGTHEGPGIRFVIFTQGCNFKCLYCHNPETQGLNAKSEGYSIAELFEKIIKCRPYFGKEGGVTVSGGEPILQAKKLIKLFSELKKAGIHTALDTNGSLLTDGVKKLLKLTDLVLLDVKHMNNEWHKKITGHSNELVLKFAKYLEDNKIKFWIRYVLVPDLSDQDEFLVQFKEYFKGYKNLERVEILPYHTLGTNKYKELNIPYSLSKTLPPNEKLIKKAKEIFDDGFKRVVVR